MRIINSADNHFANWALLYKYLVEIINRAVIDICVKLCINVNVLHINFSKWSRGTSEGVTAVAPYIAIVSTNEHYNINPPGTDRFKVFLP